MCTKHKHYDVIVAYANGSKVQCKSKNSNIWADTEYPSFFGTHDYRVKPEPVKTVGYRRYIMRVNGKHKVYAVASDRIYSPTSYPQFVRWIDNEWQYETVEV